MRHCVYPFNSTNETRRTLAANCDVLFDPIKNRGVVMIITEPRWKSYCVETTKPLFSPKQCQMIIEAGRAQPRHNASVGQVKKMVV